MEGESTGSKDKDMESATRKESTAQWVNRALAKTMKPMEITMCGGSYGIKV